MRKELAGLILFTAVTALPAAGGTIFQYTDPAFNIGVSSGGIGSGGGYDVSQLVLFDTGNGFRVTGIMSITTPEVEGLFTGYVQVDSSRLFEAPPGTPASLTAHINGTISTTGSISVTGISVSTLLFPSPSGFGPCGAAAGVGTGQPDSALADGAFSASYTGNNINPANPCVTLGENSNMLAQSFAIAVTYSGAGEATIDFGSSVLSEAEAVSDSAPEPGGFLLVGTGLLISLSAGRRLKAKRKRQLH